MPKRKRAETPAAGFAPEGGTARITPVDIQQKEFRLAFRGYNERDVDQFLDDVTEEFARLYEENKRLREDLGSRGTAPIDAGGAAEADATIRRARNEAARILSDAKSRARSLTDSMAASESRLDPSARRAMNAFLAREREFLQSLAGLIQGHAESVKEDMRRAREAAHGPQGSSGPPGGGSEPSVPGPTMPPNPFRGGSDPPSASGQSAAPRATATLQRTERPAQAGAAPEPRPAGSEGDDDADRTPRTQGWTGAETADESLRERLWREER